MKVFLSLLLLSFFVGCSIAPSEKYIQTGIAHTEKAKPTPISTFTTTPSDMAVPTGTPTPIKLPTKTPTPRPSITPTPTLIPSPTVTLTPMGGGSGIVLLNNCSPWYECSWSNLSIPTLQLEPPTRPYFRWVTINPDPYKSRLELMNPLTQESKIILECPDEYEICNQSILSGSLMDDWVYLNQEYNKQIYDGKRVAEIYRLNTASMEVTLVDQIKGSIFGFEPLPGSSEGLMSFMKGGGHGELLIYDLETFARNVIIKRIGQFYRFGITPDENLFYYRIADYCQTELITREGRRIQAIKNSDGIIGWIDNKTFLLYTANNNPPLCTRTGIGLATRYGFTGKWVTNQRTQWAVMSPDRKKVFFTSNCNSQGCTNLMVANVDGSDQQLLLENSERFDEYLTNGVFSPDGSKLIFNAGKQIWIANTDSSEPHLLLETDKVWRVIDWLNE